MNKELDIVLHNTKIKWFEREIRKDDAMTPDRPTPPVPKYEKRKISWTPLLAYSFAKNLVWSLRP